jgi:pimeloyl-ACP methyl ester carboxylesterase
VRKSFGGLAVLLLLFVAACSGSDNPVITPPSSTRTESPAATATPGTGHALARFYKQQLDWSDCHDGFQCSTLKVPLDYDRPGGATANIKVIRLRATGDRIGSLVINPGGPGGSGIDYALQAGDAIPSAVRSRFDVVGFDPRGVGTSSPAVHCLSTSQLDDYFAIDPTPDSPAERQQIVAGNREFARGCASESRPLLPHVSTPDAAHDMDLLRAALGDKKLTYLGKSYGTYLGAFYAEEFPRRVRALILDGALDPALPARVIDRTQAGGFEVAFTSFLHWCVENGCPLGSTYDDAVKGYEDLIAHTDTDPLPADNAPNDDGRVVNESLATLGTATALYSRRYWTYLKQAFSLAENGDGSLLLQLADALVERGAGGYSNQSEANTAVNCLDHPEPTKPARYFVDEKRFSATSPHFGPLTAYGAMACAFWPIAPTVTPGPLHARGAAPILVIGTTRDPATPYRWARGLARELDSGLLLTYQGDGHTVYGDGNSCVDDIGNAYLINLKVPDPGTHC